MNAQSFYTELQRIIKTYPKMPTRLYNSDECEFGDYLFYCKKLFNCFDSANCADSFYLFDSFLCSNCGDCDYAVESELCYECVDPFKCFNCDYMEYCNNMRDSSYCSWCWNCNDMFGCSNLQNKSFCVFNRQLSENEYREVVAKLKNLPSEKILAVLEDLKKKFPLTQTIQAHSENSDYGNYVHYCKNCYMSFDPTRCDDCAYVYDTSRAKNCFDATYNALDSELCYEDVSSATIFNCSYTVLSKNCQDCTLMFNCLDMKNCIGCVDLAHREYCILNRQLTKEEYEKMAPKILESLKEANIGWGSLEY